MTPKLTRLVVPMAVGLAVLIAALPASAVPKYIATPLGTLDGPSSFGRSINATGQVTGRGGLFIGGSHAFLYSNGNMTDLGTLGGPVSEGFGINDNAQVTGNSLIVAGPNHAFLYDNGTMTDLDTLGHASYGTSINNSGQVTGYGYTSIAAHAFLYSGGTMQDIGTLGGTESYGFGINSAGQVTGYSLLAGDLENRAFVYSYGVMHDLAIPRSVGRSINDAGQVTGDYYGAQGHHAFLYSSGSLQDLGALGTDNYGVSINNSGQVVGVSNTNFDPPDSEHGSPFLYSGGIMYSLQSLVVSGLENADLDSALSINDSGQIAATGCGTLFPNVCQAYRLDPVATPQSIVYKPLFPCRIVDTRIASTASGVQGPIVGNTLYKFPGFITAGSNWSLFGGSAASDCGLNDTVGANIQAIAIVITILNPNFDAFLGVGDVNDLNTILSTVALNYTTGQGLSTMYLVPQTTSNTIYFALPTDLSADLIFDVVGYMVTSDATALQCTTQSSAPTSIAGGGGTGTATSPACGAGYSLTSGSCDNDATILRLVQHEAADGNTTWFCSAVNSGGSAAHLTATANCCRVGGK